MANTMSTQTLHYAAWPLKPLPNGKGWWLLCSDRKIRAWFR